MPYFSFSFNEMPSEKKIVFNDFISEKIKPNVKYYSKNTKLWKILNSKIFKNYLTFVDIEKRKNLNQKYKDKLLFFLPPGIGLGDSVEYALAIKAIMNCSKFKKVSVAFVGRYKQVFVKYFDIDNVYENIISDKELKSYDTIFHVTLEIKEFFAQKYNRQNIEKLITEHFSVPYYRKNFSIKNNKIKNICIFPISQSPIRTMTANLLNYLILNLQKNFKLKIVFDDNSDISHALKKNIITSKSVEFCSPNNLNQLLKIIEQIQFGVFMDSGPMHIAKVLNKKGMLIITSVDEKILTSGFTNIKVIKNSYKSLYCSGSCGLTNLFNYNSKIGCFDSLRITKKKIIKLKNFNNLQRGNIKKEYIKFIANPVNCLKNINNIKVLQGINNFIK